MLFYENDRLEYKLAYRKKTGENGVENWRKSQDYSEISLTTRRTPSCFWLSHRSCAARRMDLHRLALAVDCAFARGQGFTLELVLLAICCISIAGFYMFCSRKSPKRSPWGQRRGRCYGAGEVGV